MKLVITINTVTPTFEDDSGNNLEDCLKYVVEKVKEFQKDSTLTCGHLPLGTINGKSIGYADYWQQ